LRPELFLPKGIYPARFTVAKLKQWWPECTTLKGIGLKTEDHFAEWITSPQTIVLEMDGGAIFFYDMVWGVRASFMALMFDGKLSMRTGLVKDALLWAFLTFNLQRIGIQVPSSFLAFTRWAKKLGFTDEGRLRHWDRVEGHPCSHILMSILAEEAQ
jgi:hypothetical protein